MARKAKQEDKRDKCRKCKGDMDTDCFGKPRCPTCDGPCPGCCDGEGPNG